MAQTGIGIDVARRAYVYPSGIPGDSKLLGTRVGAIRVVLTDDHGGFERQGLQRKR